MSAAFHSPPPLPRSSPPASLPSSPSTLPLRRGGLDCGRLGGLDCGRLPRTLATRTPPADCTRDGDGALGDEPEPTRSAKSGVGVSSLRTRVVTSTISVPGHVKTSTRRDRSLGSTAGSCVVRMVVTAAAGTRP